MQYVIGPHDVFAKIINYTAGQTSLGQAQYMIIEQLLAIKLILLVERSYSKSVMVFKSCYTSRYFLTFVWSCIFSHFINRKYYPLIILGPFFNTR